MRGRIIFVICAAIAALLPQSSTTITSFAFAQTQGAGVKPIPSLNASGVGPALFAIGGDVAQIPASFVGNQVFLPVRVNRSEPSLFRLDSSAKSTSISPTRLAELSLPNVPTTVLNFAGSDLLMKALPAVANNDFAGEVGRVYEGTLGSDFLNCYVAEVDYARRTLQLYDPEPYHSVGKGKQLLLSFRDGMPVVRVKVTFEKGKPLEADFILNTALDAGVVISNSYASTHRLPSLKTVPADDPQLGANGGARVVRLKSLQIGDFAVPGAIAELSSAPMPSDDDALAGEIGGGVLRRFTVVFDFPHQQLILTPNAHFEEEDHEDMSGISLLALGPGLKTFQVTQVAPGSAAAMAQIQRGDVIVGIDQDPAADLTLEEFLDAFRQVGHTYKLVISHDGQTREVTLQMRHRL